jgi:predicted permease
MSDLRHALRSLLKSPGFTAVALAILALGIGVNTVMFGLVDTLLFKNAPYPEPTQLVRIFRTSDQSQSWPHALPDIRDERTFNHTLSSLTAFQWWSYSLAEPGQPAERLNGVTASADLFSTLRVQPALGRAFTVEEQQPGRDQVAVISHEFWREHFGGDRQIVGRTLRIDSEEVVIIGVMPEKFSYPMFWGKVDLWRPLRLSNDWRQERETHWLNAIARLKPGVSLAQAQTELNGIAAQLALHYPKTNAGSGVRLEPLHRAASDATEQHLSWLALGLAGFVLLIACANLANLQLARAALGARSLAIRAALGASRAHLMKQMLTESMLLSAGGGMLGLLLAVWGNDLLATRLTFGNGAHLAISIDYPVLGFALAASLVTGAIFGTIPAWIASRADVGDALKQQARGSTGDRSQHRVRSALVVAEVALALVLLSGAGFFIRGLQRFAARGVGWQTSGLLTGTLTLPANRYATPEQRRIFQRKLQEKLAAMPGIESAAFGSSLPVSNFNNSSGVLVEGRPRPPAGKEPLAYFTQVGPGYLSTLQIPLVAGRAFPTDLRPNSPRVVVVNETMARLLWPGENPLGRRIRDTTEGSDWEEVIGVVRDVDFAANFGAPDTRMQAYRPMVFQPWGYLSIVVRAPAPETFAEPLRQLVASIDPDQPVADIRTVDQWIDRSQHNFRVIDTVLGGFALLGLALCAIGLYGVIAGVVAQRIPEFGIRLALGASPKNVFALVFSNGLRLVALGLALGIVGSAALQRLLSAAVPGLPGGDFITFALDIALLLAIAAFACWFPARRATKVDPIIALRAE